MKSVLDTLYDDMMPRVPNHWCGVAVQVLPATWYIASRIWGIISRAEPVNFIPCSARVWASPY